MSYMTVETTNLIGCVCYDLQSTGDVQNGAIVGKGDLVTGEKSVYTALEDYSDGMYLVAQSAWSYNDNSATDQNEENFINKANVPFRVYELKKDKKFKIGNVPSTITLAKGDFVEFTNGAYAKAAADTNLKVVDVEEVGFPYCIGSAGVVVTGDASNTYGSAIDTRVVKYTIQVM